MHRVGVVELHGSEQNEEEGEETIDDFHSKKLNCCFNWANINIRPYPSKGFQPLVPATQGVETPWKVRLFLLPL